MSAADSGKQNGALEHDEALLYERLKIALEELWFLFVFLSQKQIKEPNWRF